jgi:type IV pilus assembly protein PilA
MLIKRNKIRPRTGFTLIELVVVMGILAALLAIVLVAINPARQFSQANNTQRRSDVNAILNAVHQYAASNRGALPTGIDTTTRTICGPTGTLACPTLTSVDICASTVPTYVADLPRDPTTGTVTGTPPCTTATDYYTGYTIVRTAAANRITVAAPSAELSETINVTR